MDNKKVKYVVLTIILVILGIVLYKTNSTRTKNNENKITISDLQAIAGGAPVVSLIKVISMGPDSVVLSWKTDQLATTDLYYSIKPLDGEGAKLVVKDPTPATSHAIEITHLIPKTKYYFYIDSVNSSNMSKSKTVGEFTVDAP